MLNSRLRPRLPPSSSPERLEACGALFSPPCGRSGSPGYRTRFDSQFSTYGLVMSSRKSRACSLIGPRFPRYRSCCTEAMLYSSNHIPFRLFAPHRIVFIFPVLVGCSHSLLYRWSVLHNLKALFTLCIYPGSAAVYPRAPEIPTEDLPVSQSTSIPF